MGLMGHHRRIANWTHFDFMAQADGMQVLSTIGAIGLLLSQLPFVYNFFTSMRSGAVAGSNPWNATTLDWNTTSPPPHGNFAEPPQVYRGPYVYSPPGDGPDWLPQHEPPEGDSDPSVQEAL